MARLRLWHASSPWVIGVQNPRCALGIVPALVCSCILWHSTVAPSRGAKDYVASSSAHRSNRQLSEQIRHRYQGQQSVLGELADRTQSGA